MTLTSSVKNEIIKKNLYKKEVVSILQGIFLSAGSLIISNGEISFSISSDMKEVIDFVHKNMNFLFSDVEFDEMKVVRSFKNKERFELSPTTSGEMILRKLGVICDDENGMRQISELCDKSYLKNEDSVKAFLTGIFLGSGSVSAPTEKGYGYHFEVDVQTKVQADLIAELFSNFEIFPKVVERGEEFVIYLKNSESICDAISLFGANKAVLDLMNKKVDRDMSNLTNRQINCISANLDKTVNASVKQIKAIEIIQNTIGIENLPENLCETALLRVSNPDASLKDLISLMEVKISKGALAQRLEKIIKISQELGEEDEQ